MSTIERAAARLASRNGLRSKGPSVDPIAVPSEGEAASPHRPPEPIASGLVEPRFFEIDLQDLRQRGFVTPDTRRSRLAQEMRRIKRPLLLNIQKARAENDDDPPPNLIMIASALPGEGKTFIAINLAMSMAAEVDRRVLLVDADVAKGDLSEQFGIRARRGLSDLLQEQSYLSEDAVLTSNVDRLSVLPAGAPTDRIDELFASGMMAVVTRALAEADPDRVVIFDASPLLATTEAAVLAQRMGQTLLVVEANKTPQDAVGQALAHLEGCANVSMMLNKAPGRGAGDYSYGYGYGYGESTEQTSEAG